jgi:urate oxidase
MAGRSLIDIELSVRWTYGWTEVPYRSQWHQVRRVLFDAFGEQRGMPARDTVELLGGAVLDQCPAVSEVELELTHGVPVPIDLASIGAPPSDRLFLPADDRPGLVTAVYRRGELPT